MKPSNMRYFDVHSHVNFPQFDADRDAVIAEMAEKKIATITVGTGVETSEQALWLAERNPHLFASAGFHPLDAGEIREADFTELEKLVGHERVVAVGECGLDYSQKPDDAQKKIQQSHFERQIEIAVAADKPLIIHGRDAYPDIIAILQAKKKEHGEKLRGDFHFFTSPVDIARQCLDLGFYVSFTGPITFVDQYRDVVAHVPLERMMVETDAPFAAPVSHRGNRNSPLYVPEIARKVAEIKSQPIDMVEKALVNNGFELFLRKR